MSMKRLAVHAAIQASNMQNSSSHEPQLAGNSQGYNMSSSNSGTGSNNPGRTGRFETDLHGNVNILLGGAMLSGVLIFLIAICYCCHRKISKYRPHEYSHYWRGEPADVHSLEVFTMDSHAMCYERTTAVQEEGPVPSGTPGPPPAYESLIFHPQLSPNGKKDSQPCSLGTILPIPTESEMDRLKKDCHEEQLQRRNSSREDEGLPSYEAALKLEADGYV